MGKASTDKPAKKRHRRTAAEIKRTHFCHCGKGYGSEASLLQHSRLKHPPPGQFPYGGQHFARSPLFYSMLPSRSPIKAARMHQMPKTSPLLLPKPAHMHSPYLQNFSLGSKSPVSMVTSAVSNLSTKANSSAGPYTTSLSLMASATPDRPSRFGVADVGTTSGRFGQQEVAVATHNVFNDSLRAGLTQGVPTSVPSSSNTFSDIDILSRLGKEHIPPHHDPVFEMKSEDASKQEFVFTHCQAEERTVDFDPFDLERSLNGSSVESFTSTISDTHISAENIKKESCSDESIPGWIDPSPGIVLHAGAEDETNSIPLNAPHKQVKVEEDRRSNSTGSHRTGGAFSNHAPAYDGNGGDGIGMPTGTSKYPTAAGGPDLAELLKTTGW